MHTVFRALPQSRSQMNRQRSLCVLCYTHISVQALCQLLEIILYSNSHQSVKLCRHGHTAHFLANSKLKFYQLKNFKVRPFLNNSVERSQFSCEVTRLSSCTVAPLEQITPTTHSYPTTTYHQMKCLHFHFHLLHLHCTCTGRRKNI